MRQYLGEGGFAFLFQCIHAWCLGFGCRWGKLLLLHFSARGGKEFLATSCPYSVGRFFEIACIHTRTGNGVIRLESNKDEIEHQYIAFLLTHEIVGFSTGHTCL